MKGKEQGEREKQRRNRERERGKRHVMKKEKVEGNYEEERKVYLRCLGPERARFIQFCRNVLCCTTTL
jgi:hypothetical protein